MQRNFTPSNPSGAFGELLKLVRFVRLKRVGTQSPHRRLLLMSDPLVVLCWAGGFTILSQKSTGLLLFFAGLCAYLMSYWFLPLSP